MATRAGKTNRSHQHADAVKRPLDITNKDAGNMTFSEWLAAGIWPEEDEHDRLLFENAGKEPLISSEEFLKKYGY